MKTIYVLLCLSACSGAVFAEQTNTCAGLEGTGLALCRSSQETLRQQERLEQQLQLQQERQNQLDQQQRDLQQQLESVRLQNESLRKQLELQIANQPARPVATKSMDDSGNQELKSWKADNAWFGTDYAKTQFAMRYAKQLQHDRPDLTGRPLLDAISTKVNENFRAKH